MGLNGTCGKTVYVVLQHGQLIVISSKFLQPHHVNTLKQHFRDDWLVNTALETTSIFLTLNSDIAIFFTEREFTESCICFFFVSLLLFFCWKDLCKSD